MDEHRVREHVPAAAPCPNNARYRHFGQPGGVRPKTFWELHNRLWHGVEPEEYREYSPAESSGIEQLLESMRRELPPPAAGMFGEPSV